MEFGITRMSSKGQIVIPREMRNGFREGEKIFVIEENGKIILKNKDSMRESVLEDFEFARRTEEAYRKIESGLGIRMDFDDFIEDMKKW